VCIGALRQLVKQLIRGDTAYTQPKVDGDADLGPSDRF